MDPITLHFTPVSADYDQAKMALEGRSDREVYGTCIVFALLFGAMLAALVFYREPGSALSSQTIFVLIFAGVVFLMIVVGVPLQYRKKFRENPQLTMPVTWEVDEEGITVTNHLTRVRKPWIAFRGAAESGDYLFLVDAQNEKNFLFLTKKTLQEAQQLDALRALLRQKIGLRAAGKKR